MFRNFDAETLELEYSPASRVPDVQIYLESYATRGLVARDMIKHERINYGDHIDEWLWYAPSEPLDVLVDQTCRAIEFLRSRHAPARTVLVGHSAGAHLVAMAMCNTASTEFGGAILVSGLFDLEPIIFTSVNDAVKLDPSSARRLSPIHLVTDAPNTPILVTWGENETEEFKRQSREFASAWLTVPGHNVATTAEIASHNHFDVLDELTTSCVMASLSAQ